MVRYTARTLCLIVVLVSGMAPVTASTGSDVRLNLRRDRSCDPGTRTFLSVTLDPYYEANCGEILPIDDVQGQRIAVEYPAADGVPLRLDARRDIRGTIRVYPFLPTGHGTGTGAGQVVVDGTITGTMAGENVTLGAFHEERQATPLNSVLTIPVSVAVDDALDLAELTGVTLSLVVSGLRVSHGLVSTNRGYSYLTVPAA